jgi:hypothetical protein
VKKIPGSTSNTFSADLWAEKEIIYSNGDEMIVYSVNEDKPISTSATRQGYIAFIRKMQDGRVAIVHDGCCSIWNPRTESMDLQSLFNASNYSYQPFVLKGSLMFYIAKDATDISVFDLDSMRHVKSFKGSFANCQHLAVW